MKVILATWHALRLVGRMCLCVAAFFLWSAIAAGAGWMFTHLPDIWYVHLETQSNTSLAVAAITSCAVVAGALFLAFSWGALQMVADTYTEILLFVHIRRSQHAISATQRCQFAVKDPVRYKALEASCSKGFFSGRSDSSRFARHVRLAEQADVFRRGSLQAYRDDNELRRPKQPVGPRRQVIDPHESVK